MRWESESAKETFEIGRGLAAGCRPGDVYCLYGEPGAGKTVFTQGFASGLGIAEPVSSPTFTIIQEYDGGRIPLYHFDVYRIGSVDEMDEIGFDDYLFGGGVCLIEWANLIEEILPGHAVSVTIEKDPERGYDYRAVTVERKEE